MRNATGERRRPTGAPAALALVCALGAALGAPARAADPEVRLEARADREEVALGEAFGLRIRVEAPDRPTALELPGEGQTFRIVSRAQSSASSFSLGTGGGPRLGHTVTWQLGIAPLREGTLTVGPVVVVVRGERHVADAVTVKVLPRGAAPAPAQPGAGASPPGAGAPGTPPRGAQPVWRGWERDLAYEAVVDRREAFLGEPVTISTWILSPVDLAGLDETVPPAFEGFWVEELERPQRLKYEVREVNGIPVRAYLVRRAALFPARAGKLTIAPVEVELAVRLGTGSPFDPFPEVRRARRRTKPIEIAVKPLPAGAPAGFRSVNVGTFSLSLETDRATVPAGEPVTVRLVASGSGNLRALALPALPAIAGAKAFDPVAKERVAPGASGLQGERVLETVLVPERTGDLVIPALEWPYFDPRTGRYEVARTAERR
ncbi:MAG TPA: BatD family protein, partial [Anaeromyxobacteraceae bacterium]|nr:BatD family protein [Anaeromyxobacteraceae bacterium]